ncbi:MAG: TonB-dependent receptor, partial [Terracidiphilus sp.]
MNRDLRAALVLAIIACAGFLVYLPADAQSVYGSIFGTVTDASGAAVPNATITVKDTSKGTIVTATSNASGDYSVPHLIPDVYDLTATAKGFRAFTTTGISVLADAAPRIDPTLEVGSESTTVQVNADTVPMLKTDRADVSTVFDQQQVSALPVGDQNFTNLQLLLPGAQKLGWSHAADENPQGSQQIQVDGQAFGGTAFELDGTDNQDPILGIIVINPTMDAVTETKITTQNFDAELGKAVSAVVTAQTRSGTNSFHGSAYDWRTGNANLARDPFTVLPGKWDPVTNPQGLPPGLKNRFGGSIGGPIVKDRLFFFGNYEGQRQKVGTSNTNTVPTAQMVSTCLGDSIGPSAIAGCDFSEYAAVYAAGGGQLIFDNLPNPTAADLNAFAHNVVPANLVSPQIQNLLKILQAYPPNAGTPGAVSSLVGNFNGSGTGLFNSNQWTVRGDYTLSQSIHAFGRFSRFTDSLSGKVMFGDAGGPGFGLGSPPYGGNSSGANDSAAAGMDFAINPKLLTDFRLGYYRYNVIDTKFDQGVEFANQLGIPGLNLGDFFTSGAPGFQVAPGSTNSTTTAATTALIGGGLSINRCNCPLTEREDQFQAVNNWTKVMGNHTLKVGADLRYARNLRVPSDTDRAGLMNFYSAPTAQDGKTNGLAWATFALGEVPNFGRYVGNTAVGEQNAKEFQKRFFFYGQDSWRPTRNLTLNLGLRWDLFYPESVNGPERGALMNINDGYMHVAGVGGIPTNMGWSIEYHKQFAPRIGMAFQPNDKTVIRAGYGRSFDTGVFGSIFGHVVTQNIPVLANQSLNAPGSSVACEFNLGPGSAACNDGQGGAVTQEGPPAYVFPTVPANGLLPAPAYNVSPKQRPNPLQFPTIDAWNLALQRALTPTMTLTIAYVGNKGTHTLADGDGNNTNPNEAALVLPAQYSVTGQTLSWDPDGLSGALPAGYSGGVSNANFLQRYYGASLPACRDAAYQTPISPNVVPGMCGWTQSIASYSDNLNTEFDALQVTWSQTLYKGVALTANYQWASAFDEQSAYATWDRAAVHARDSNVRTNQLVGYGSWDLPFGRGRSYANNINRGADLLIGGWQASGVLNWSSGLPWTISYDQFAPFT